MILMKKDKKILYINDYANSSSVLFLCDEFKYPRQHLWGADALRKEYDVTFASFPSCRITSFTKLWINFLLFFKYWRYDLIYSAVPNFTLFFSLCKLLRLKKYKLVTIIHHPTTLALFISTIDKLIFISEDVKNDYINKAHNKKLPAEYVFWGGDMDFYTHYYHQYNHKYDFICAGEIHRDFSLLQQCLPADARCLMIGNKSSVKNEINESELMEYYLQSRFVIIPIVDYGTTDIPVLAGLTSFVDALCMRIPVIMSDNTLIGVDIEELGFGRIYKAGNSDELRDVLKEMQGLSDEEYKQMRDKISIFLQGHTYEDFCKKIYSIITSL